jgi:hypothetical protein
VQTAPSAEWVQALVEEAKEAALFKDLPAQRAKGDELWLMELASKQDRRPHAMQALMWLQRQRERGSARMTRALVDCGVHLPDTELCVDHASWVKLEQPTTKDHGQQRQQILDSMRIEPFVYEPEPTELGPADRHPWHGVAGDVWFGDVGAGSGLFAAVFKEAGARCRFLMEPQGPKRQRAVTNAGGAEAVFETVQQVDPVDVPWVHILQGGPE